LRTLSSLLAIPFGCAVWTVNEEWRLTAGNIQLNQYVTTDDENRAECCRKYTYPKKRDTTFTIKKNAHY
jgi:hypothetical protein